MNDRTRSLLVKLFSGRELEPRESGALSAELGFSPWDEDAYCVWSDGPTPPEWMDGRRLASWRRVRAVLDRLHGEYKADRAAQRAKRAPAA